jgi:hypothetical protein
VCDSSRSLLLSEALHALSSHFGRAGLCVRAVGGGGWAWGFSRSSSMSGKSKLRIAGGHCVRANRSRRLALARAEPFSN